MPANCSLLFGLVVAKADEEEVEVRWASDREEEAIESEMRGPLWEVARAGGEDRCGNLRHFGSAAHEKIVHGTQQIGRAVGRGEEARQDPVRVSKTQNSFCEAAEMGRILWKQLKDWCAVALLE